MKQLLDFPRGQRLEAYKAAGSKLLDHASFSCLALSFALSDSYHLADVEPQFWWRLFGDDGVGNTVETRDARWPRFEKLRGSLSDCAEANDLRNAIGADAQQTRLMMLAWVHAVDEAGDLEDLIS